MTTLRRNITSIREDMAADLGMDPVEHLLGRIKSEDSMREKCRRKGLPETPDSALIQIHDAIGIRVVCAFLDDIYTIRDRLLTLPRVQLVEEKDYIRHVKPNGYRSFHMIILVDDRIYAEIQLRTMAMNFWAVVEHSLQYKYNENIPYDIRDRLSRSAEACLALDNEMASIRTEIMEAHELFQKKANVVQSILNNIRKLYSSGNQEQVLKLQNEFFTIYNSDNIGALQEFNYRLEKLLAENGEQL